MNYMILFYLLPVLISFQLNAQDLSVVKENPYEIYVNPSAIETYMGESIEVGEGKQFTFSATLLTHSAEELAGEWCISIWKNGKLQKSYPQFADTMKRAKLYCYTYACWIDVPAGDYEMRPLFRKDGDLDWTMPQPDYSEQRGWKYTFLQNNSIKAPSCSYFFPLVHTYPEKVVLGSTTMAENFFKKPAAGEPFVLKYNIKNKYNAKLTGELVAYYERDVYKFTLFDDWYLAEKNPDTKWHDEVGRQKITIAPEEEQTGYITIKGTSRQSVPNYVPLLHMYFQPAGTSELIPVRDNCDSLFGENHLVKEEILADTYHRLIDGMQGTFNFIFLGAPFDNATGTEAISFPDFSYNVQKKVVSLSGLENGSTVCITNMAGSVITKIVANNNTIIDLNNKPGGVYVLTVVSIGKQSQSCKIVIR